MVTIAHCNSIDQAQIIKSWLEGNGLEVFIPDEFTAQTCPPYLFAGSGVRVQVRDEDVARARALLEADVAPDEQ